MGLAAGTEADKVLGMMLVRVVVVVGMTFLPISLAVAGEPPADLPPPIAVGAGLMGSAVLLVRVVDDSRSGPSWPVLVEVVELVSVGVELGGGVAEVLIPLNPGFFPADLGLSSSPVMVDTGTILLVP